ncbi:GNAT family protein [Longispora sp. NPDC051575]|uniref:GNAT family N-acetyltransferase n=1 Tax=Longispora sp. NPDC051575 TaxID=3154943 RepID=UPI00341D5B54
MTYWPFSAVHMTLGDVVLTPTVDADLIPLADLMPADVELDPRLPRFGATEERAGRAVHQYYWRHLGGWHPESWCLDLTVRVGGRIVGSQNLEAADFATLRTVETASWLGTEFRGRGIGKAMRIAALALAFDGLGAQVAETEAWHDNAASLGVSRAVGYVDNGVGRHPREGSGADDMVRMRLTRDVWEARHAGTVGLVLPDVVREYFGVA